MLNNTIRVVDLFHGDQPDFHALIADGISRIILKASQGTHTKDPRYDDYRARGESVGFTVDAYHFFEPGQDITAQINWFLLCAKPKPETRLVLDTEKWGDRRADEAAIEQGITLLKQKTERFPWHYGNDSDLSEYYSRHPRRCPLWVARYGAQPKLHCEMWQFTENARLGGQGNAMDESIFYGTLEAYAKLGTASASHLA